MYLFFCHMKQNKQSPIQDATITSVLLAFFPDLDLVLLESVSVSENRGSELIDIDEGPETDMTVNLSVKLK